MVIIDSICKKKVNSKQNKRIILSLAYVNKKYCKHKFDKMHMHIPQRNVFCALSVPYIIMPATMYAMFLYFDVKYCTYFTILLLNTEDRYFFIPVIFEIDTSLETGSNIIICLNSNLL